MGGRHSAPQEHKGPADARLMASADDAVNVSNRMPAHGAPKPTRKATDPGCWTLCTHYPEPREVDALCIGAGIMSSTVGLMLQLLEPNWKIVMCERLFAVAHESSNGFNNSGTGHAGFMEPNYTKLEPGKDKRTKAYVGNLEVVEAPNPPEGAKSAKGKYILSEAKYRNDHVWVLTNASGVEALWIYKLSTGRWGIGNPKKIQDDKQGDHNYICSEQPSPGKELPHQLPWGKVTNKVFKLLPRESVTMNLTDASDGGTVVPDGKGMAVDICQRFLHSREYWAHLYKHCPDLQMPDPNTFIQQSDHIALGIGPAQAEFIKKRYEAMHKHESGLFSSMECATSDTKEGRKKLKEWAPIIMEGRKDEDLTGDQQICMTRVKHGTDVDFGALTRAQVAAFARRGGEVRLNTTVTDVKEDEDGEWIVTTKSKSTGRGVIVYKTKFLYVGAGGWALLMLQKAGLQKVQGYMALPVTGNYAVCQNPEVIKKHRGVKVYAPGAPGAPNIAMPHLDYRTVDGREMLIFGPFGSITTKFLRNGSNFDVFKALKFHNLGVTIRALSGNLKLVAMLMKDVFKSGRGKLRDIRVYFPEADPEDWTCVPAGVRAQIIMKDETTGKPFLQYGTEIVNNEEGTICGHIGVSPGASACVSIALDTLEKCFQNEEQRWNKWKKTLQAMVPSWSPNTPLQHMRPRDVEKFYRDTGHDLKIYPKK